MNQEIRKSGKILGVFRSCVPAFLIQFFCVASLAAQVPDQAARWNAAELQPKESIRLDNAVALYRRLAPRYHRIEVMRAHGVPAPVLFCLHYRESDNNFTRHLHEGSPLTHRTRDEPRGRLLAPHEPPFTFEQSAEDAYYVCERPPLDRIDWRDAQAALDKMESFNGYGYRSRGIAAPYLWSGTNLYTRGKFIADHRFSATAIDAQLGCAAILKRMQARGVPVPFGR
jgi:lysozyme family protein